MSFPVSFLLIKTFHFGWLHSILFWFCLETVDFMMHLVFAGRMALLVTLFLVLVNIFNSVTANAPKSEGLTAVETWVVMCILHVFCVLLEYAIILKIIQVEKRKVTTRLLKLDRANNALSASNTSLNNKSLIFSADRANRFHIV